jgi:hypothetical protein
MAAVLNIAFYDKNDWDELMNIITDKHTMNDTWDEWFLNVEKTEKSLALQGFKTKLVKVDLRQLELFCAQQNITIDGKARAKFVSLL